MTSITRTLTEFRPDYIPLVSSERLLFELKAMHLHLPTFTLLLLPTLTTSLRAEEINVISAFEGNRGPGWKDSIDVAGAVGPKHVVGFDVAGFVGHDHGERVGAAASLLARSASKCI